jgi:Raf kinase inhibitor-like YbhB/YbcL family protein
MSLQLSSSAFEEQGDIPKQYTADGRNTAPPLSIRNVPQGTKSLALVVDDPDAPRAQPFVHWVVYDISPETRQLTHDAGTQGINDFGRRGYGGPKPPSGRHHYHFKLYALDAVLGGTEPLTKAELEASIEGHVLEKAELVGTYAHAA